MLLGQAGRVATASTSVTAQLPADGRRGSVDQAGNPTQAEALGTTDLYGGALFNAEFGIRHRGSTVPERSGVALSFCRRPFYGLLCTAQNKDRRFPYTPLRRAPLGHPVRDMPSAVGQLKINIAAPHTAPKYPPRALQDHRDPHRPHILTLLRILNLPKRIRCKVVATGDESTQIFISMT